jgi:protein TonB
MKVKIGLRLGVRLIVIGAIIGGVWLLQERLAQRPNDIRNVQRVTLLDAPKPKAPPPKGEEKPVEQKEEKQIDLRPDLALAAPGPQQPDNRLGLDAEGAGGGDAFGLQARRGGRDITTIGPEKPTIGGGGGGDAPPAPNWGWYGGLVQRYLQNIAQADEHLQGHAFIAVLQLWISPDGHLSKFDLVGSTGDSEIDQALKDLLAAAPAMIQPPPAGMPQPVRLRMTSRLAG